MRNEHVSIGKLPSRRKLRSCSCGMGLIIFSSRIHSWCNRYWCNQLEFNCNDVIDSSKLGPNRTNNIDGAEVVWVAHNAILVSMMHLATIALLCKQTTDNIRTRHPPEPRWRHLSGNRILFVPHYILSFKTPPYTADTPYFSNGHEQHTSHSAPRRWKPSRL